MAEREISPLEQVLRLCASAAPQPWYPRVFARQSGTSKENLSLIIEHLLLDGLLERTTGSDETGPGLVLSARGTAVLKDPEALERLRQGQTLAHGGQGAVVREALRRRQTPYVSRTLLALNILVFLYGMYLAATNGVLQPFLTGLGEATRTYLQVMQWNGSVTAESWLRGEWWRTVTACFVHFGLLHIGMNMYMLYSAGGFLEQMWGRTRFLVIYTIAGVVGTCVGLAHLATVIGEAPNGEEFCAPLAGASTALCGIIAAEAVWVWLNGKFLPQSLVKRWQNDLMIQTVMIVFISFFPGISGWGHFGGAVAGALAALLLNYHRFAPSPWRWAALLGLVPLPLLGPAEIYRNRVSTSPTPLLFIHLSDTGWKQVEAADFNNRCLAGNVRRTMSPEERKTYRELVEPLLDMDPKRRQQLRQADVEKALTFLAEQKGEWSTFLDIVNRAGPFYGQKAKDAQEQYRDAIAAHQKLYELAERCLHPGGSWTVEDETALREQRRKVLEIKAKEVAPKEKDPSAPPAPDSEELKYFEKTILPKIRTARNDVRTVWDEANALIERPAKERVPERVAGVLTLVVGQEKKMSALAKQLDGEGPYKDNVVEKARKTGRDYMQAWVTQLELAERCLREGDKWTEADTKQLADQVKKVEQLEKEWQNLIQSG